MSASTAFRAFILNVPLLRKWALVSETGKGAKDGLNEALTPVLDSDIEKLSPLQCGHINMQGCYSFTVPESVCKGELIEFNEEI